MHTIYEAGEHKLAEIEVSAEHKYRVRITGDWRGDLTPLITSRSKVALIYPVTLQNRIPEFKNGKAEVILIPVPDGETGKSSIVVNHIWDLLARNSFTRSDLVVAVGGGTITDCAGFAAASWLRGIDWVAVPTTLAGMVDAAVGGKTGINSPYGKNLIGAFHSPTSVIIDTTWLATLSDRDFAAGLAEVVKCGFIEDPQILEIVASHNLRAIRASQSITVELIERAVATKAKVVSEDFKESSLREILNYGHTFGHAIESVSGYSIRHGEAVAIGMVFAAELALSQGLISEELVNRHRSLLQGLNLPTSLVNVEGASNWPALYAAMTLDKKSRGSEIRFVAITEPGICTRMEGVTEDLLYQVYEKVLS